MRVTLTFQSPISIFNFSLHMSKTKEWEKSFASCYYNIPVPVIKLSPRRSKQVPLLCQTGPYRLPCFANWLDVSPRQQRALEGHVKWKPEKGTSLSFPRFALSCAAIEGGGWVPTCSLCPSTNFFVIVSCVASSLCRICISVNRKKPSPSFSVPSLFALLQPHR